jgi:hypothetical protein
MNFMNVKAPSSEPEFSHPLPVDKISSAGVVRTLEAGKEERQRLAARFGILELTKLHAELTVRSVSDGRMIEVKGRMMADVVQKCVVTLEPLPGHIERAIEVLYTFDEPEEGEQPHLEPDAAEIEPIVGGVIDIGELVAQNFGIALDPYPRTPGVALKETVFGAAVTPPGALAKLAEWAKKPKE